MNVNTVGAKNPKREERRADRAQTDAKPNQRGDLGNDRGGREHDRDLGQAAAKLIMSEPAIGQFPRFRGLLGAILDRFHAVFRLLRVFFVSRDCRFEVSDLLLERLLRFRIGHRAFLRFQRGCRCLYDRRANALGLVEIEEVGGFDIFFRRQVLGVFCAGFRERQQKRENGDDEGDGPTFFLGLNRGVAGFRHRKSPLWERAAPFDSDRAARQPAAIFS